MSNNKRTENVIFTTHTFYPNLDGVAVVNNYLACGLVEKGFNVCIFTHRLENIDRIYEYKGLKIFRIYEESKKLDYVKFLKEFIDKDDVLINVCTQTPTTDSLYKELDNIQCKKKILYVHGIYHFGWEAEDWKNPYTCLKKIYHNYVWKQYYLKNKKYLMKYDIVTQLHECDEGNIFFTEKLGIKTTIVENAVDDSFFEEKNDTAFLNKYGISKPYFICVANFDRRKNQEMVLRAYYECDSECELIFIGKDCFGYLDYLKQIELDIIKSHNNEIINKKVRYYDDLPRDEVSLFVRNAKLYLYGSKADMFPISIAEAMAAGIPFIATDVGVIRHLPGGIVVKIDDNKAMASNIDNLIANCNLCNALSQEGREYAKKRMRVSEKVKQVEEIILG